MEEIFDIYTRDGKYLGKEKKSICHSNNPGFYHKPALIWIINSEGDVLIQKRAKTKKFYPNIWDVSCAGHVESMEDNVVGALRELKEELGIDANKDDLDLKFQYIFDDTWELAQVYLLNNNKKENEFILQEEEVECVKWMKFEEFEKFIFTDEFAPYDTGFKVKSLNILKNNY